MPRPKPRPETNSISEKNSSSKGTAPSSRKTALYFVAVVFLLAGLVLFWNSEPIRGLFAGPKIPLPRQTADLSLGMTLDQVLQKYPLMNLDGLFKKYPNMTLDEILLKHPEVKKSLSRMKLKLRPFNNDPLFGITTVNSLMGVRSASSLDLLFFKDQLYFVSTMWDKEAAVSIPVDQWVKDFRRWNPRHNAPADTQSLGNQVLLKEWHFSDGKTEMVVRDLNFSDHLQRWQDIRDASNEPAQAAFAKYRLEAGN